LLVRPRENLLPSAPARRLFTFVPTARILSSAQVLCPGKSHDFPDFESISRHLPVPDWFRFSGSPLSGWQRLTSRRRSGHALCSTLTRGGFRPLHLTPRSRSVEQIPFPRPGCFRVDADPRCADPARAGAGLAPGSGGSSRGQRKALNAVFQDYWEDNLSIPRSFASTLGDKRYNDQISDYSVKAVKTGWPASRTSSCGWRPSTPPDCPPGDDQPRTAAAHVCRRPKRPRSSRSGRCPVSQIFF